MNDDIVQKKKLNIGWTTWIVQRNQKKILKKLVSLLNERFFKQTL